MQLYKTMCGKYIILFIATIISSLLTPVVYATNYYITPNGNDLNTGVTTATAWADVAKSITKLHAGDSLHIGAGTYKITNNVTFWNISGTAANPITVEGEGSTTVLDGSNASKNVVGFYNTAYINFQNMAIKNSKVGQLIAVTQANHITISNVELSFGYVNGVWMDSTASNILLHKLYVHDNAQGNINGVNTANGNWGQGINLAGHNNTAQHCVVENNWGEGIDAQEADGALILNNVVHDNFSVSIYLDHTKNTTVDGNLAYYSYTDKTHYRSNAPGAGISIADEGYDPGNINTGNRIINNVVVHTLDGIGYRSYGDNAGMHNTTIWNNTIVDSTLTGLRIDLPAIATGNDIENNIVYGSLPNSRLINIDAAKQQGLLIQNNFWYAPKSTNPSGGYGSGTYGQASVVLGQGDVVATDPLFVGGCGGSTIKVLCYTLKKGSAAINAAKFNATNVPTDYNGITRINPTSMGAFK